MNLTRDRVRTFGWAFILSICLTLTVLLTVRVEAVKSQVQLAERQVMALKRENLRLETEFETRANQQQLSALNQIEFGYKAPNAHQYIAGERQLASLSKAQPTGAPAPVRMASALEEQKGLALTAMVSPLTGQAQASEPRASKEPRVTNASELADKLSRTPHDKVHVE